MNMNRLSVSEVEEQFLPQLAKLEKVTEERDTDTIREILDTLPSIRKFPKRFQEILITARDQYMWKEYQEDIHKLQRAIKKQRTDQIRLILERLPPKRDLPGPYDGFVEHAEEILEREEETKGQAERIVGGEIPEGLRGDQDSMVVDSIEQLYSRRLRKYKARIKLATKFLEEGKLEEAKDLVEDLTLKGCPTNGTEQDLRYLKEELGIK